MVDDQGIDPGTSNKDNSFDSEKGAGTIHLFAIRVNTNQDNRHPSENSYSVLEKSSSIEYRM